MSAKKTWFWLLLALGLFAFIFFHELPARRTVVKPLRVLPGLNLERVRSVEVLPKGLQLGIRAERTNGNWTLSLPLRDLAESDRIENLLKALESLEPKAHITESELATNRFNSDETYGFTEPQATLVLEQDDILRLRIGRNTPPGDQMFLQVVGVEGVFVVDTNLLNVIPKTPTDWRDTALLELHSRPFDRVTVTNGHKALELQRNGNVELWRMLSPRSARADSAKIETAVGQLEEARISRFLPDDPKPDLETLGLQPPDLQVTLAMGSNNVAVLQFGKTNEAGQVYARRLGRPAIFTVPPEPPAPWHAAISDFRDSHLVALVRPVSSLDIRADDTFSLRKETNGTWRVLPQNFPADAALVQDLLTNLSSMPIVDFTADVASELSLPKYGLAPASRDYAIKWASTNAPSVRTNAFEVALSFGATNQDMVYARRADESSVYAVRLADFQRLPSAGWQLRERSVWNFEPQDVAQVTIRQDGRVRQLDHNDAYEWKLAPHSEGVLDGNQKLAIEETVRGLAQLSAVAWAGQGSQQRARCGFSGSGFQVTLKLKNGEQPSVEFGGEAPSGLQYAAVTLGGESWIFEFPALLYRDMLMYLSAPPPR